MSRLIYALVFTAGVVMFAIGALAGPAKPWKPSTNSSVEQTLPLPTIVKAWDRHGQTGAEPF
jgi:hypothetical protein